MILLKSIFITDSDGLFYLKDGADFDGILYKVCLKVRTPYFGGRFLHIGFLPPFPLSLPSEQLTPIGGFFLIPFVVAPDFYPIISVEHGCSGTLSEKVSWNEP